MRISTHLCEIDYFSYFILLKSRNYHVSKLKINYMRKLKLYYIFFKLFLTHINKKNTHMQCYKVSITLNTYEALLAFKYFLCYLLAFWIQANRYKLLFVMVYYPGTNIIA